MTESPEKPTDGPHGTAACGCPRWMCQRARDGLDVTGRPYQVETWDQLRARILATVKTRAESG